MSEIIQQILVPAINDEQRHFLQSVISNGGAATARELPSATQAQNAARQRCRRNNLAYFEGGYWRITPLGRQAFNQ